MPTAACFWRGLRTLHWGPCTPQLQHASPWCYQGFHWEAGVQAQGVISGLQLREPTSAELSKGELAQGIAPPHGVEPALQATAVSAP